MERIMKYINRVYRASVLDREKAFAAEGLAGHQLSYILQICRDPGLSQDDLANRLFVNKSSVTRQVAQLIEAGFIQRETCSQDKRCRRLYPTAKAQEIYPRLILYLDEWNEALTGDLTEADQENLVRLLRLLAGQATAELKDRKWADFFDPEEAALPPPPPPAPDPQDQSPNKKEKSSL